MTPAPTTAPLPACPSCGAHARQTKAGRNRCGTQRLQSRPAPPQAETVEMDELYTFIQHKKTSPTSARR